MKRWVLCIVVFSWGFVQAQSKSINFSKRFESFPADLRAELQHSIEPLKKHLTKCYQSSDKSAIYLAQYYLGQAYSEKSTEKSNLYHDMGLHTAQSMKDTVKMAWSNLELSRLHDDNHNYGKAIRHLLEASDLFKRSDDYQYAHSITRIGELYFKLDAHKTALDYYHKALHLKQKHAKWSSQIPYAMWCLAEAHYALGHQDSALFYYRVSSIIADTTRNIPYYGNEGVAQIKIDQAQYDSALYYLEPIPEWYFSAGVPMWIADMGLLYMKIYFEKGNSAKFSHWSKITKASAFQGYLPEQRRRYHEMMAHYFSSIGQSDSAYKHMKAANEEWAHLVQLSGKSNMGDLVRAFHEEKQANALLSLESELRAEELARAEETNKNESLRNRNRQFLWGVISICALLLFVSIISFLINQQRKRVKAQKAALEEANEEISSQIEQLKLKENRIRQAQLQGEDIFAIIRNDLTVIECNSAFEKWANHRSQEKTHNARSLAFLSSNRKEELQKALQELEPYSTNRLRWTWEEPHFEVIDFSILNLCDDPTVLGYIIEGKNATHSVLQERIRMDNLKNSIKEKEQLLLDANKKVAISNLQLELKREMLSDIQVKLNKMAAKEQKDVQELQLKINQSIHSDRHWNNFTKHFDAVHVNFFKTLKSIHPDLTANEEKHCAFLKMRLSNKEVATILGVAPETAKKARQRLKKKLNLPLDENLKGYIERIA